MKIDDVYCIIKISKSKIIELYIIEYLLHNHNCHDSYPLCFMSDNSSLIIQLLNLYDDIALLSIQHALYLGQEVYKADIALITNQIYIQD